MTIGHLIGESPKWFLGMFFIFSWTASLQATIFLNVESGITRSSVNSVSVFSGRYCSSILCIAATPGLLAPAGMDFTTGKDFSHGRIAHRLLDLLQAF
jgi:hypothetical protein